MKLPIIVTTSQTDQQGQWSKHAALAREDGSRIIEFHALSARANRVSVTLAFGGEDREIGLAAQIWKLPLLTAQINSVTKSSADEDIVEYGFSFVEDIIFVDWKRTGGYNSEPTHTIHWMNILFGDLQFDTNVLETRVVEIKGVKCKITLNENLHSRPRLPGYKRYVRADIETITDDADSESLTDRMIHTSFLADSIDDAIQQVTSQLQQRYETV
jgi:hypothetical protein